MPFGKYFDRLNRLHSLIRRRATGTPGQLAARLDISERQLYEYLREMRELGTPIAFDSYRQTYYYTAEVQLELGFRIVTLTPDEEQQTVGGYAVSMNAGGFDWLDKKNNYFYSLRK